MDKIFETKAFKFAAYSLLISLGLNLFTRGVTGLTGTPSQTDLSQALLALSSISFFGLIGALIIVGLLSPIIASYLAGFRGLKEIGLVYILMIGASVILKFIAPAGVTGVPTYVVQFATAWIVAEIVDRIT